ncbi:MAG: hypothetical protein K9H26_00220 [Prolixibacteraceae bacterium]|nr:hypothetical protein [Prolixibacteraceae bacterium]
MFIVNLRIFKTEINEQSTEKYLVDMFAFIFLLHFSFSNFAISELQVSGKKVEISGCEREYPGFLSPISGYKGQLVIFSDLCLLIYGNEDVNSFADI